MCNLRSRVLVFLFVIPALILATLGVVHSFLPDDTLASQAQELRPAGKVELLRWKEGDQRQFFRVELNVIDSSGAPSEIPGREKDLQKAIKVYSKGKEQNVFYVIGPEGPVIKREVMMLVDISGSMKSSFDSQHNRYTAAKKAAMSLLKNFQDGVDTVAIVPFESHNVIREINNADFASTRTDAESQIDQIRLPFGNTALYSSVATALDVLKRRKDTDPAKRYELYVLTDGKNDVNNQGDDRGLLDGESGLTAVREKSEATKIPIFTVGIGTPGDDFDGEVLNNIAYPPQSDNYSIATNSDSLEQLFKNRRQSLLNRLRVTFFTNNSSCTGINSLIFKVVYQLPDTREKISTKDILWSCGSVAGCPTDGMLTESEGNVLLKSESPVPCSSVNNIGRTVGIFAFLSGLLALLWFVPPRVIWPPRSKYRQPSLPHKRPRADSTREPVNDSLAKPRRSSEPTQIRRGSN